MSDLINWLTQAINDLFDNIVQFFTDIPLIILNAVLTAISAIVTAIPVPDFVSGGMSAFMSAIDPSILYFLGRSGLPEAFALLGVGLTFRLTRKVLTLGQW